VAEPEKYQDALNRYCDCMEELKRRISVIDKFLSRAITTGYKQTDVESMCLQMRKVLELIALASLVANKAEYSKQHKKFADHWHAARILQDLEAVNPNFYPVPGEQVLDPQTGEVVRIRPLIDGFLTRNEFSSVYDTCSSILHAENPYGPRADIEDIQRRLPDWRARIICLLNHHQTQLAETDLQFWVLMHCKEEGKVQAWIFKRLGPTTA